MPYKPGRVNIAIQARHAWLACCFVSLAVLCCLPAGREPISCGLRLGQLESPVLFTAHNKRPHDSSGVCLDVGLQWLR